MPFQHRAPDPDVLDSIGVYFQGILFQDRKVGQFARFYTADFVFHAQRVGGFGRNGPERRFAACFLIRACDTARHGSAVYGTVHQKERPGGCHRHVGMQGVRDAGALDIA